MTIRTPLMGHQRKGLEFLKQRDGGGLLWEPGTGKTLTVISYMDYLTDVHDHVRVLVVAPLSAVDTWPDEIEKHRAGRGQQHEPAGNRPLHRLGHV